MRKTYLLLVPVLLLSACGVSEEDVAKISADTVEEQDAYEPVSSTYCLAAPSAAIYKYGVVTYSNGDKYVTCSIHDAYAEYSDSAYYFKGQSGASAETCILGYDLESDSLGGFQFENDNGTRTATYVDSTSSSDGIQLVYESGDCVTTER